MGAAILIVVETFEKKTSTELYHDKGSNSYG